MSDSKYVRRLEDALKEGRSFSVYNKDTSHASAIIKTAFRYAATHIRLLSNKLDLSLYGEPDLIQEVVTFLNKGDTKFEILVEQQMISSKHPILELSKKYSDRVTIALIPPEQVSRYDFNFMVVDDIGYRFEHDRRSHTAIASFNETNRQQMITSLKYVFDHLLPISKKL